MTNLMMSTSKDVDKRVVLPTFGTNGMLQLQHGEYKEDASLL
jgi:hypothetical protein